MIVAIEGIDGSGKATQTALVGEALRGRGRSVATMSFPRYGKTHFAGLIAEYLSGSMGDPGTISPKLIGLLYAGDRLESLGEIRDLCARHEALILDRYTASNLAYQGAKLVSESRVELVNWMDRLEHGVYGLPRADLNVLLDVPVDIAMGLVRQKRGRTYTHLEMDVHESNRAYLQGCREVYMELMERSIPGPWVSVQCVSDGVLMEREAVRDRVLGVLREHGLG